jgi:hypothetical protein
MELSAFEALLTKNGLDDKYRFVAKFTDPFLLIEIPEEQNVPEEQGTVMQAMGSMRARQPEAAPHGDVARIVRSVAKSDRNAYDHMITLGRAKNNDIIIPHGAVSKFHAYFRKDPVTCQYAFYEGGSSYGTTVNGQEIRKDLGCLLSNGDTIVFASLVTATFFLPANFFDHLRMTRFRRVGRV